MDVRKNGAKTKTTLYTAREEKEPGKTGKNRRAPVLGYFEGEKVVGYTTLDEINRKSYTEELPECELEVYSSRNGAWLTKGCSPADWEDN